MAEVAKAFVSIIPSARGFSGLLAREIDAPAEQAGRQAGEKAGRGFGGTFVGGLKGLAAPLAAAFAGAGVVSFFGDAIRGASELEQSVGGVEAVFKDQAGAVSGFAASAAENLGLSRDAYNGLAAIIGTTLKSSGTPLNELADATDTMIGRAADLAATFGGPVPEASAAMAAALRGEFEPLRRYGVSLDQAAINSRALADTGKTSASALTAQEKAAAAQAIIMERSADSAGRFAAESDTLAGKQERVRAQFENTKATLGQQLLPAMSGLMGFISGTVLPGFQGLIDTIINDVIPGISSFASTVNDWKVPIGIVAGVITAVFLPALIAMGVQHTIAAAKAVAAWAIQSAASIGGAAAQSLAVVRVVAGWVLMGVQSLIQAARMAAAWLIAMGPVGWVIAAVIGLAALIIANWDTIVAWTKQAWTNVTAWLSTAWTNIKATASSVWNAILDFFKGVPGKLVQFFLNFTLPGLLIKHWDSIKRAAVEKWNALVSFIKEIPGKIVAGLGNLGQRLYSAGQELLQGLINGITNKVSGAVRAVKDAVGNVIEGAKNLLGISSPSRVFMELGGYVAEGLALGIDRNRVQVSAATNRLVGIPNAARANLSLIQGGSGGPFGGAVELGDRTVRRLASAMVDGASVVSVGAVAEKSRAVHLAGRR